LPYSKFTFQVSTNPDVRPSGVINTESVFQDIAIDDSQNALRKAIEVIQKEKLKHLQGCFFYEFKMVDINFSGT
jgi:hypothetical protein